MRRFIPDVLIALLFFLLPLLMFSQQTVGGRTLIPTENLYQYEPFATYREVVNAPEYPHNHLVSDSILQNFQWKSLIRQNIKQGEIPLWNPHQFSGIPFMAAGQQSTLYPVSLLYYLLPLTVAYGWVTVVNLWLAGLFMYAFLRGVGIGRFGGTIAGITYQLCGFFIASAVFPMIIGAAVWMPLLLLMAEFIIRQQPILGRKSSVPWVVIGAGALGCSIFAGHVEITIYTLLILAYYAAARLVWEFYTSYKGTIYHAPTDNPKASSVGAQYIAPSLRENLIHILKPSAWLALMVALGFGLGSIQFIPLYEFVQINWRADRSSLDTVLSYAHPTRDLIQYVMPNFYGSPAQHSYLDVFTLENTPVNFINATFELRRHTEWGIKNYVEGALYVGILPLVLAAFALLDAWLSRKKSRRANTPPYRVIFALLGLISLTFMFGLPTYAAIYILPGINQLNSAFRWVFGVTLGVAVLAGIGADVLARLQTPPLNPLPHNGEGTSQTMQKDSLLLRYGGRRAGVEGVIGYLLTFVGIATLAGLLISRVFYTQLAPTFQKLVDSMALANTAFADERMFYSVQFWNVLIFGIMALLSGIIFIIALPHPPAPSPLRREGENRKSPLHLLERGFRGEVKGISLWQIFAVILVAADLMIASWNFNPASDPALLDFTPPAIQWLIDRQQEETSFRYTTLDVSDGHLPLMQPNSTMRYGLDDIRGYDSIISKQYVDYMQSVMLQTQLDFNRISPLYADRVESGEVDWERLNLLNVRYIVTHISYSPPAYLTFTSDSRSIPPMIQPVYTDESVRIWRNNYAWERLTLLVSGDEPPVIGENLTYGFQPQLQSDTGREKFVSINMDAQDTHWLVISQTYAPGWRAYIRPAGANTEKEVPVQLVMENFQGIRLNPDEIATRFEDLPEWQTQVANGEYTLRIVYSPTSFQVGLFGSVISAALAVFLLGVWIWRLLVGDLDENSSTTSRVARNSIAPIILNLFNRGIDFAFAFVMLRILGPEDAGIYYYAIIIFVWFDIFTNFGLDVFLIREVSRHREQSGYYFFNTSAFRLLLMVACVPLLIGFLLIRQAAIEPELTSRALTAIGLLYIGLAPGSLNKGLTSLFYAFERAEIPAAVTTITTINKTVLQVIALLLGYGIIGLAGMSIVVNFITLGILFWAGREMIMPRIPSPKSPPQSIKEGTLDTGESVSPPSPLVGEGTGERGIDEGMIVHTPTETLIPDVISPPHCDGEGAGGGVLGKIDRALFVRMRHEGFPLMLNHFLATIFFQIDVVILEFLQGAVIVGQYSVAYRWLLALNIIPAFFTQALFPVMSRQASEDRAALRRTYTLGVKLLVMIAFPLAVIFTFLAETLTLILAGQEYLPVGAIALQFMIWSIPIGWINSLTQYALIAVDLQRRITRAFAVAVTFNIVSNILLIPQFSYRAAAVTTILSELVLLIPFALIFQGAVGKIRWLDLVWRPGVAAGVMLAVLAVGWNIQPFVALLLACIAYPGVLWMLNPLAAEEWAVLMRILPARFRRMPVQA